MNFGSVKEELSFVELQALPSQAADKNANTDFRRKLKNSYQSV